MRILISFAFLLYWSSWSDANFSWVLFFKSCLPRAITWGHCFLASQLIQTQRIILDYLSLASKFFPSHFLLFVPHSLSTNFCQRSNTKRDTLYLKGVVNFLSCVRYLQLMLFIEKRDTQDVIQYINRYVAIYSSNGIVTLNI